MTKLTAGDLMVIHESLYLSLSVADPRNKFTRETREQVMNAVMQVLNQMEVKE